LELIPVGGLEASLHVDQLPLDWALDRLPGAAGLAHGLLTGDVKLKAPADKLTDPASFDATATLRSDRLEAYGLALTKASADLALKGGVARAASVQAELNGAPITGGAELDLTRKGYPFRGEAKMSDVDLAAVQRLAPSVRPPVSVAGKLTLTAEGRGQLSPWRADASAKVDAADLAVADVRLSKLHADVALADEALALNKIDAELYQGRVWGSVTVPLKEKVKGTADLHIEEVDLKGLARALPNVPLKLEGRVSGKVTGELAAGGRSGSFDVDLKSDRLKVQNIATQHVTARVGYHGGRAEYRLEGDVLGGKFELEGRIPAEKTEDDRDSVKQAAARPALEQATTDGRFRLTDVHLSRLGAALGAPEQLAPLHGRINVELTYRHLGPEGWPVGSGYAEVLDLRWDGVEITDRVRGQLRLTEAGNVELRNVSATVGEGSLRATVVVGLRDRSRGWFSLSLSGVDSSRALAPFPGLAGLLEGPLDAQLRGSLGRQWRGSGTVGLSRGHVAGVDVAEWRLPVDFGLSLETGTGYVNVRDSVAQLGHGRAVGDASLTFGAGVRLEGGLRFFNADLKALLRPAGETASLAGGRLTGRVTFGADNLRSVNDLNATLTATLGQTQAFQLPILSALVPFLAPGQANTTFQAGDVQARLSGGVLHVQRLALAGSWVRLLVVGNVIVANGRLDLDATAATGLLSVNPNALRTLGLRIPAAGPIPVGVLLQATAFLSNRTVHLRVSGTVRNPVLRVEPLELLTEEAARLFLSSAGVPTVSP
jgi:translocation and assembly module TamB